MSLRQKTRSARHTLLLCSVKMEPGEFTQSQQIRCDGCRQTTPGYEIVNYGSIEGGYRRLCGQCLNHVVAKAAGLEGFEHAKFQPVGLVDCAGNVHEFHFRTHLFGPGVALDAFELRDGSPAGYRFQIIGDPEFGRMLMTFEGWQFKLEIRDKSEEL